MTQQYECDVTGNTTTHAPKVTFDVGASYGVPTSVGLFTLSTNYAYTSQFFFTPDDRLSQPAYELLNSQLVWTPNVGNWTLALYGENILNNQYTIAQYAQDGLDDLYVAGKPAMFGIETKMKF